MTDPIDTEKLRELIADASDAPWWGSVGRRTDWYNICGADNTIGYGLCRADALLVVAMRGALPSLLDRLAAAEVKAERMAETLTWLAVDHEVQAKGRSIYAETDLGTYHTERAKIARRALGDTVKGEIKS